MNAFQVLSLALLSVLAANAQVIKPGRCPQPAVQKNFDAARVLQQQQQNKKTTKIPSYCNIKYLHIDPNIKVT